MNLQDRWGASFNSQKSVSITISQPNGKDPSNEHLKFLREQLAAQQADAANSEFQAKPRDGAIPFEELLDWTRGPFNG